VQPNRPRSAAGPVDARTPVAWPSTPRRVGDLAPAQWSFWPCSKYDQGARRPQSSKCERRRRRSSSWRLCGSCAQGRPSPWWPRLLDIPKASLGNWVRQSGKGALSGAGGDDRAHKVSPEQVEPARLRAENARLRMDATRKKTSVAAAPRLHGKKHGWYLHCRGPDRGRQLFEAFVPVKKLAPWRISGPSCDSASCDVCVRPTHLD
jgi:hypothetical protein